MAVKYNKTGIYLLLGISVGILSFLDFPLFVAILLAIGLLYICVKDTPDEAERKFLLRVLFLAIVIRMALSFFILLTAWHTRVGSDILGDARPYEGVGAYIKELATGRRILSGLWGENFMHVRWLREVWRGIDGKLGDIYSVPSVAYWYGFLYSFWGLDFLAPKVLNGLFWVLGSFWLYLFFQGRYGKTAGLKIGLVFSLFLPSALLVTASGLKDSLLFLLIISIIFSAHRIEMSGHRFYGIFSSLSALFLCAALSALSFIKISFFLIALVIIIFVIVLSKWKNWFFYGLLMISSSILLSTIREHVYIIALIFGFLILINRRFSLKGFLCFILILIFSFLLLTGRSSPAKADKILRKIMVTSVTQNYNTAYGNTAFQIFPKRFYLDLGAASSITYPEFLLSYFNGLRHVFTEPVPWRYRSFFAIFMFPEVFFLWLMIPCFLAGFVCAYKINRAMTIATGIFFGALVSLLALGQGNIGTLVRIRMMVMPWYFMFGGMGLYAFYSRFFNRAGSSGGQEKKI